MPNCVDVGLSTPIAAIAYWGNKLFGATWCDIMNGFTSLFPYFGSSLKICQAIKNPSPTQGDRYLYCAIMSSGSILLIGVAGWIIGTFIIAVVLALINALHAVILLIPTLPFYDGIAGMGSAQGVFEIQGENEMPPPVPLEEGAPPVVPPVPLKGHFTFQPVGLSDRLSKFIQRMFLPNMKVEKIE
jgi:hypothetical protein